MDMDGDVDLVAVMHAENVVAVYYAATSCDGSETNATSACCWLGSEWNGSRCVACADGFYGVGSGAEAKCEACPDSCCPDSCKIAGLIVVPPTCFGRTVCADGIAARVAECDCGK